MQTSYRFSAPGRTEISGNHTDHQHGCVLAAAVDLETTAEVTLRPDSIIRVASEGYAPVEIDLNDLSVHAEEKNTTAALVRGVAAAFAQRGCKLHGFDAAVRSTVLPGSGLSSSAAFEVLIGTICNELFFDKKCSAIEIAQIGQYAENVYFGKPCGLMDQMASSVGGLVFIDFADPAHPAVRQAACDFAHCGYTLCTLDSGADHADLTDEYAAIPEEMRRVARVFGKEVLREVDEAEFYANLKSAREAAGDRAVLRAMHFFDENRRVQQQVQALERDDFEGFLAGVRDRRGCCCRTWFLPGAGSTSRWPLRWLPVKSSLPGAAPAAFTAAALPGRCWRSCRMKRLRPSAPIWRPCSARAAATCSRSGRRAASGWHETG